mmetsp:Transcript_25759/g.33765  ORF Transcript_25759/g.33765 Transcript_25759/m.33765 type:complete len:507 (-) Transcript_25759:489-2009(-)
MQLCLLFRSYFVLLFFFFKLDVVYSFFAPTWNGQQNLKKVKCQRSLVKKNFLEAEELVNLPLPPWDDTSGATGSLNFLFRISKGEMKDAILSGTVRHGSIYRTIFLGESYIMVGYDAMQCLVDAEDQGKLRVKYPENMQRILGDDAIILLDGEKHLTLRKLVFQAFNRKALESYVPSMESTSLEVVRRWKQDYAGKEAVKLHPEIRDLIIGMGVKVLIGSDILTPERFSKMKDLLSTVAEGLSFPLAWDVPFTPFGQAMSSRREIFEMLDEIIAEKRAELLQNAKNVEAKDILSLLLAAENEDGSKMSDNAIKDNLVTLTIAAQDTTASAVTSALMNLALNENLQCIIKEELQHAEEKQPHLGFEFFDMCPTLDRFVTETLRMQPPATAAFREVVEDFEFNGYRVPKDANVIFMMLGNHYDERSFKHPNDFDTARYDRGEGKALAPFGFGFHTCAGAELARLEMKVFLKSFLETLKFSLVESQDLSPDVFKFSVTKSGLLVRFNDI